MYVTRGPLQFFKSGKNEMMIKEPKFFKSQKFSNIFETSKIQKPAGLVYFQVNLTC